MKRTRSDKTTIRYLLMEAIVVLLHVILVILRSKGQSQDLTRPSIYPKASEPTNTRRIPLKYKYQVVLVKCLCLHSMKSRPVDNHLRISKFPHNILTFPSPRLSPLINIGPVQLPVLDAFRQLLICAERDILQALDFQGT
jgi:hypothetical protein